MQEQSVFDLLETFFRSSCRQIPVKIEVAEYSLTQILPFLSSPMGAMFLDVKQSSPRGWFAPKHFCAVPIRSCSSSCKDPFVNIKVIFAGNLLQSQRKGWENAQTGQGAKCNPARERPSSKQRAAVSGGLQSVCLDRAGHHPHQAPRLLV